MAYFFGVGAHLDVYQLVMRGANLINNLLGEGTLSASFIPIYSRMLEEGRERDAGRFAGAIFGLLVAVAAAIVAIGLLAAPIVVAVLAPGFLGDAALVQAGEVNVDRYALAVGMFRIALPMAALLALSAWALGVLNSHRRFLLP
ncbi:MAG: lipid II flippase MurJ, partial [Pseudomonadota bacterium]